MQILRNNISSHSESLHVSNISNSNSNDLSSLVALGSNENHFNIACANARSLVEKVTSLVTLFEENELHLALLTETWLSNKHCPPRTMADLTIGANINSVSYTHLTLPTIYSV